MPEIRYIEHYDTEGNLIEREPYEVSDEQLEREEAERTMDELSTVKDTDLTVPQAAKFLKALAKLRR